MQEMREPTTTISYLSQERNLFRDNITVDDVIAAGLPPIIPLAGISEARIAYLQEEIRHHMVTDITPPWEWQIYCVLLNFQVMLNTHCFLCCKIDENFPVHSYLQSTQNVYKPSRITLKFGEMVVHMSYLKF